MFADAQATMVEVRIKSLLMSGTQLLAGWVGLALSTACLRLFPDFPVFSVVEDDSKHGGGGVVRRTHRRASRHDNAVGMWVVAELVFFCLLTGIASLLYCCCRRHQRRTPTRSGTWYVHLRPSYNFKLQHDHVYGLDGRTFAATGTPVRNSLPVHIRQPVTRAILLPRDAILARYMLSSCLSVHLSVRPSVSLPQVGVLQND